MTEIEFVFFCGFCFCILIKNVASLVYYCRSEPFLGYPSFFFVLDFAW